ncbi:predicted protein, partial [Arabidopsis lyrata subsp. lyrata]
KLRRKQDPLLCGIDSGQKPRSKAFGFQPRFPSIISPDPQRIFRSVQHHQQQALPEMIRLPIDLRAK